MEVLLDVKPCPVGFYLDSVGIASVTIVLKLLSINESILAMDGLVIKTTSRIHSKCPLSETKISHLHCSLITSVPIIILLNCSY